MQLSHAIVHVRDVNRAVAFYQQALGLAHRFTDDSGTYAEMDTGATTLAFAAESLGRTNLAQGFTIADPAQPPQGAILTFLPDDVTAAYQAALAAGASSYAAPERKPWGQEVAYVRDPDGNLIELAR